MPAAGLQTRPRTSCARIRADVRLLQLLAALAPLFALVAVAAGQPVAPRESLDPAFAQLPFEQWLAGAQQARIEWGVTVSRPRLSAHQRLRVEVDVRLDGAELARRRGEGQLLILVQIADQQGRRYQNHINMDLAKLEAGVAKQDVISTFTAFVTPGDYRVAAALYDTASHEHCLKQVRLDVPPLRNDPLPGAWLDLPPVEYLPAADPPDSWYLPALTEHLRLPLKSRSPVDIDLIVNLTPSESASHAAEMRSLNLSVLVPALKVISEVNAPGSRLNAELLDLSRQHVVFRQNDVHVLDWAAMRSVLAPSKAATIDLQSLERHRQSAAFFVAEVARIIAAGRDQPPASATTPHRVLIVLSGPLTFGTRVDLDPIAIDPPPDCRVFYIRYHSFQTVPRPGPSVTGTPRRWTSRRWGDFPGSDPQDLQFDQLESTLRPLAPRLFDVDSPEGFRKALANLLADIANQ